MKIEDRFDSLIQYHCERLFPACDWRLIKAQVAQESNFKPNARSPVGAQGLLQLMPATDLSIDNIMDGFDIEGNLDNGIRYLLSQYTHLPEIAGHEERLKFSLAAYNGGRGYVNRALELAYKAEHGVEMPPGHKGAKDGRWQTWEYAKEYLLSPDCVVNGRKPDWKQITEYVGKIWPRYLTYKNEVL